MTFKSRIKEAIEKFPLLFIPGTAVLIKYFKQPRQIQKAPAVFLINVALVCRTPRKEKAGVARLLEY